MNLNESTPNNYIDFNKVINFTKGKFINSLFPLAGIEIKKVGKHQPCPICGGKDRFMCDDKDGTGSWHCNNCGAGYGLQLIALKLFGTKDDIKVYEWVVEKLGLDKKDYIWQPTAKSDTYFYTVDGENVALKAQKIVDDLQVLVQHEYLDTKQVYNYGGLYVRKEELVVPIFAFQDNGELSLCNIQRIFKGAKGFEKRFLKGGQVSESFSVIGLSNKDDILNALYNAELIAFVEGYATGCTVKQALDSEYDLRNNVVICSLNANNLSKCVGRIKNYLDNNHLSPTLYIFADNDEKTAQNGNKNAGVVAGITTANKYTTTLIIADNNGNTDLTDFNDISATFGFDVAREQIVRGVYEPKLIPALPQQKTNAVQTTTNTVDNADIQQESTSTQELSTIGLMTDKYIYITKTNEVYDKDERKRQSLTSLQNEYPHEYNGWKLSRNRQKVKSENIFFDPTGKKRPLQANDLYFNTFAGFPFAEVRSMPNVNIDEMIEPIMGLIKNLFGKDLNDENLNWFLNWLAYIVQNAGAKMDTAIIVHGHVQGSGKSLFFAMIMRRIFGKYAKEVGQGQLSSNFNAWMDEAVFVVFEEIFSNNEVYHTIGRVKQFITGGKVLIERKHMDGYEQDNYANFVFLSNEQKPMVLEQKDRRFFVLYPEEVLPKELQKQIGAILDDPNETALKCFYLYLLNRDIGDFDNHTKPIDTQARLNLMALSSHSADRFVSDWVAGELDFPFIACLVTDLYKYYQTLCQVQGERSTSLKNFSLALARQGQERVRCRYSFEYMDTAVTPHTKRTDKGHSMFVMGVSENTKKELSQEKWLGMCVLSSRDKLNKAFRGLNLSDLCYKQNQVAESKSSNTACNAKQDSSISDDDEDLPF